MIQPMKWANGQTYSPQTFWWDRNQRGWPAFLLALALTLPWQLLWAESPYNRENFPDADQTLDALRTEESDKETYYIWRDAEGRMHTTPYQREKQTDEPEERGKRGEADKKKTLEKPLPDKVWSQSLDLNREALRQGKAHQADPEVLDAMGIDSSRGLLSRFSEACCQGLEMTHSHPLPRNRGRGARLDTDSPEHGFETGSSHYVLIPLPDQTKKPLLALRLRSFIHNGVFLPTLVFLDRDRQPQRLVTNILFDYEPERWHRHGYLEAWLPMDGPGMEAVTHILVLTRAQDLKSQTLLGKTDSSREMPVEHRMAGELELKLISP